MQICVSGWNGYCRIWELGPSLNSMPDDPIQYPDISSILDRAERRHCQALFEELCALTITEKVTKERIDEVKRELDTYQETLDAPGIQHSGYVYSCQQLAGRRTLNETLLMSNGCPKDVIDQSYTTGKPYERRTFRLVSEGKEPMG